MKPLVVKLAAAAVAALAVAGIVLLVDSDGSENTGEHVALLQPLGKAYAKDYGIEFTTVDTAVAATVAEATREEWTRKLVEALSVGYDPITKPFRAIALEQIANGSKVRDCARAVDRRIHRAPISSRGASERSREELRPRRA